MCVHAREAALVPALTLASPRPTDISRLAHLEECVNVIEINLENNQVRLCSMYETAFALGDI